MTILDAFRRDEARVLDRLIDGELSQDEHRQLLAALDDEPGGWRRCALAFLEAQTWRWQLSRLASEPLLAQLSAAEPKRPGRRFRTWGAGLAIAAGLLVAFVLGTRFPDDQATEIAATRDSRPTQADPLPVLAGKPVADARPSSGQRDPAEPFPWQTLTLVPVDGGPDDTIELRVLDADDDEAAALASQQSAWTGLLLRRFEQEGFEVTREQHWIPIDLSDGRRVLVPVEEVDIRSPDVARL